MRKGYITQWTSQFYAAAELTRRGYLVSLTFGNAPVSDLLVHSPSGTHFSVDVKGQASRGFWLIQRRPDNANHFFILVYIPPKNLAPEFFIMSSEEMMKHRNEYENQTRQRGTKYRDDLGGFNWGAALPYKNKWEKLPK